MSEVKTCRWQELRALAEKACGTHKSSAAYGALLRAIDATEMLDLTALAAQRDEGLAREAELRAAHESQNKDYIQSARIAHGAKDYQPSMMMPLANKVAALQQRLAEAEKLLRELKNCKWNTTAEWQQEVTDLLAGPGCSMDLTALPDMPLSEFMELNSPGCADGENSK